MKSVIISDNTENKTLLVLMREKGVILDAFCGGRGICGGCTLKVNGSFVRSCEYIPKSGDEVIIPQERDISVITADRAAETKISSDHFFGAAVDIGTTTLAFALVDIDTGAVVKTASRINSQRSFGADVISRISASVNGKENELKDAVLQDIASGLEELKAEHGVSVRKIVISANTTMVHLLLGFDCSRLGVFPFKAYELAPRVDELCGIKDVYVFPAASAFVGGDIIAGALRLGMDKATANELLLDLGTNAEMLLRTRDGLYSASAAAGQAFEGNGEYACDAIASVFDLYREGKLSQSGAILSETEDDGVRSTSGRVLTAEDISDVIMAKAAVRAGIDILLSKAGIKASELYRVYISGGFGYYLDIEKAVGIGLLPDIERDSFVICGNTSLKGAIALFGDEDMKTRAAQTAGNIIEIVLANEDAFDRVFLDSMRIGI